MIRRLIVVTVFDGVDLLDVTGPAEVFSLLEREMSESTGYELLLVAETMAPVVTSAGVRVLPDATFDEISGRRVDTLIVPGAVTRDADGVRAVVDPAIVRRVRMLAPDTRRVASVCVGAHVLAAAGLLDGLRATTHWSTAAQLAAEHPAVTVDADPIFIREGGIWTGAGLTACLDLSLALVAEDFGQDSAQRVARQLVMYMKRPSGQSQFSVSLSTASSTPRIDELRHHIATHIGRSLTVPELAARAHVSDRQLTRIFKTELGMTPAAYVESARVEVARSLLETGDDTLQRVAADCGFGTVDTLTRAFRRRLGVTPSDYRARFQVFPAATR
ncbi:MAG: helix-turn-helix domain-containing protein [Microbacterium sp.]|jgi:transcriptional regulator GlxA family with amidase domain|nr:helix-turn-helix domain-containing protein [Microbacterium sp.]